MNSVDGFVAAVPTAHRAGHLEFARTSAAFFTECGTGIQKITPHLWYIKEAQEGWPSRPGICRPH